MSKMSKVLTHDELGGHLFLAKRLPALRWHELDLGLYAELGNHDSDAKGETQVGTTHERESTNAESWGGVVSSVRRAAHKSGGLKSHWTRDHGSISKSGGNSLLAEQEFGGQGVHREVESEGFEENHRVVINCDEPVGQRWRMVESALVFWGSRKVSEMWAHICC